MVDAKQLSWIEFHQQTRKLQQNFKLRLSQLEHVLYVARIVNVSVGIMAWVKSSEHFDVDSVQQKPQFLNHALIRIKEGMDVVRALSTSDAYSDFQVSTRRESAKIIAPNAPIAAPSVAVKAPA